MNKFWKWVRNKVPDPDNPDEVKEERTLYLNGTIGSEEDSWFYDTVTPEAFRKELGGEGDITVWINSVGGDVFAADRIYNMLRDYKGKVTVKIDGIAASAASFVAMAGDEVLVSPVSTILVHNPSTIAMGDHNEMQKAIDMLDAVKNSIINAYALKTGLSRKKLSDLMESESLITAYQAIDLHFADGLIERSWEGEQKPEKEAEGQGTAEEKKSTAGDTGRQKIYCLRKADAAFTGMVIDYCRKQDAEQKKDILASETGHKVEDCMKRLDLIKTFM